MRIRNRRRTIALAAAGLAAVASVATTTSAQATGPTMLRNWATGVCMDSNSAGSAYAIGCNFGNYQNWIIGGGSKSTCGFYGCGPLVFLEDNQTFLYLTNSSSGNVTTAGSTNTSAQYWLMTGNSNVAQFQNTHTGLCLQTNCDGGLFTTGCGSNFQDWKQGF